MNTIKKTILLTILLISYSYANKEQITLQLQWKHQFQFAGYYMAKEKGFYDDFNLDVKFLEFQLGTNILEKVLNNKAYYATGRASLINERSHGKKVVLLASILQSSPLALVTKKSSNINTISDFKNKRFMITNNEAETSIFPLLLSNKISRNDLKLNIGSNKLDNFIKNKTDIITIYTSNQEYALRKKGIEYNIFHPKDFDFDFYDDILFTSELEATKHKQRTSNFTNASIRGWEYAFDNIEETVELILKKYNSQKKTKDELLYEAQTLKKLAYRNTKYLGNINKNKIQRIYDIYHVMGLTTNSIDLDSFIFDRKQSLIQLTSGERQYLKDRNNTISIHNEQNWPPYNFIKNNQAQGFSIDYMNLLASKLNIKTNYIQGDSWSQFMKQFKDNDIDVMLNIVKNEKRMKFMDFTTPYAVSTKAIFTNDESIYLLDDLSNKKVAVQKDSFSHQYLEKNYPKIKLKLVNNAYDAITSVINGEVIATVENFAVAKFLLAQNSLSIKYARIPNNVYMRSNLHLGTMKNNKTLHSILEKGINSISQEEIESLKRKWLSQDISRKKLSHIYSSEEKEYLKNNKIIRMCNNPNWEPIEFAEHGDMTRMAGIAIDTIHKIEKNLHIRFQTITTSSWTQSQQYLKEKKCDILPAAIKTEQREKYAIFTQPYLKLPLAIFTAKDKPLVNGLSDIIDQSWSRQRGSGLIHKMQKDYPNNKLVVTNTTSEAFQFVNNGTTYFTIATLPVATNIIQKYQLDNLQIAGYSNIVYQLSIAVRDDNLILRDILNKSLNNISVKEHRDILKFWTNNEESFFNTKILKNIFIIIFILAILLFYRQYLLKKTNSNLQYLVQQKTRELKELNLNLEKRIEEAIYQNREKDKILDAQSKMASMGEMIGNIAHQWRQPLSVISTGVTGMQAQKEYGVLTDEQFDKTCSMINENAQYLSKTIDDFKNFIQGNREKNIFNLNNNLNSFIHLVEGSIKENEIEVILNIDKDIEINGYENELSQCFINIFNNSKDALKEKSIQDKLIIISASLENHFVIISVQDNAKGIDPTVIDKVFEPYFTTKHKSQGTGLGLHMTYKLIVNGMHGEISVENKTFSHNSITYTGASFQIKLPIS